jgi:hypothetical protein
MPAVMKRAAVEAQPMASLFSHRYFEHSMTLLEHMYTFAFPFTYCIRISIHLLRTPHAHYVTCFCICTSSTIAVIGSAQQLQAICCAAAGE